jgi:hypothetical protein
VVSKWGRHRGPKWGPMLWVHIEGQDWGSSPYLVSILGVHSGGPY